MTETELPPDLIDRVRGLSTAAKDRLFELAYSPTEEAEYKAALKAELTRRCDDVAACRVPVRDADEFIDELAAKYGEAPDE